MTQKRKYSETILARCCRRSCRDCGTSSQFRSLALPVYSEGGNGHDYHDFHPDHQLNTSIMFTLITIQVTDMIITRSTRCPLAPPPRKVATVPCPLLPAMDRGKLFLCYFSKTEICIFMENHFRKALHKLVTHPTTLTSQNSGREVIISKLDFLDT